MAFDEESLTDTVSEPSPSVGAALLHAARARTRRSARRSDRALPPPLTFYTVTNWTLERLRVQVSIPGMHEGIHGRSQRLRCTEEENRSRGITRYRQEAYMNDIQLTINSLIDHFKERALSALENGGLSGSPAASLIELFSDSLSDYSPADNDNGSPVTYGDALDSFADNPIADDPTKDPRLTAFPVNAYASTLYSLMETFTRKANDFADARDDAAWQNAQGIVIGLRKAVDLVWEMDRRNANV